jgi:large subunit ribosomal protein L25
LWADGWRQGRGQWPHFINRGNDMADIIHVQRRQSRGTRYAKRLRAEGKIPAVLYGHGKENISLSVPADELSAAMRHGAQLVELAGEVKDSALIREAQWDTFGTELLHVDFTRVVAGESVQTTVPIQLRGDAPGAREGGIVEHLVHEIEVECPVTAIPEKITVRIHELGLDDSILASDLSLPEGTKLLTDPSTTIVHCTVPAVSAEEEEALAAAEAAEPEIIGREGEEEGEQKAE